MFSVGSPIWMLILGLLIGFLAAWAFDYFYWRRRTDRLIVEARAQAEADAAKLRAERDRLQMDLRASAERVRGVEADLSTVRAKAAELEPMAARVPALQAERDRLAAELAEAQARLRALEADLSACGVRVGELSTANNRLEADLGACGARVHELTAQLAAPASITLGGAGDDAPDFPDLTLRLQDENALLGDELAATKAALLRLSGNQRDPLIDINGIGPVYQDRLYDAGIVTFEQLAALTPEQLRAMIKPADWQAPDFLGWIAEARQRIGQPERDALIDISGIGPVYERKLWSAGVVTFDQLAALSAERIEEIISPAAWQKIEPEAWIVEARTLAQQVRDGSYRKGER